MMKFLPRFALVLALTATRSLLSSGAAAKPNDTSSPRCGAADSVDGKCGVDDDGTGGYEPESGRGAAGTTGAAVPKCGPWCADDDDIVADAATPCSIDTEIVPCQGEYWCTTTCGMWRLSVLDARDPDAESVVTCEQFAQFSAFQLGAVPCPEECLLDEIKPDRYPAPTGVGIMCAPGTCDPGAQSRYRGTTKETEEGLAVLECPCNWFGSDCSDDWVEIEEVVKKERHGDFEVMVFRVSDDGWRRVLANHRPGGVVRIQSPSASTWGNRPLEQPYALATDAESSESVVGELEILTGPPQTDKYHPTVTEIARRVRSLPVGPIHLGDGDGSSSFPLYVNPSVAGFFNKRYMFLMDALAADADAENTVEHVVMVATGAGLSGVRSAIARVLSDETDRRTVHLYYGLRDGRHLPYRSLIESWTGRDDVRVTLLASSTEDEALAASEPGISEAIRRGAEMREKARTSPQGTMMGDNADKEEGGVAFPTAALPRRLRETLPASGKIYAQHAVGIDFSVGSLKSAGASLENTVVVICGRNELLLHTDEILRIALCDDYDEGGRGSSSSCDELFKERVFTNI